MADELNCKIHKWLSPLSWLYGMGVGLRNKLFDWGWLRSESFDIPVICIGNLAVGGTGKTPHTEYLIRLLQKNGLHVAVLSRGYKRRTKGYVLATSPSTAQQIGDEPFQIKNKFPDIVVAVDEDRRHGIKQLMKFNSPPIDVILLDDAFQHRYVEAGVNILLTDYNRLWCDDALLPAGRLREPIRGKDRAHIVIVTKCPDDIKPIDFNITGKQLQLYPYQQLYFSHLHYGELKPVFDQPNAITQLPSQSQVILLTGIAQPNLLQAKVQQMASKVVLLAFADHHPFTAKDLNLVKEQFQRLSEGRRYILTTEKDAARLQSHPSLPEELKPYLYVLPIEIEFLQNQQKTFNQYIIEYVRKNSRDSILSQRKDAHAT